jgi:hypothetical protein
MRVWDISPGYLNRQSLLGEHVEIHALVSIVENDRRGFAHHPETLRWKPHLGTLRLRHDQTAAEMRLRGYQHNSPIGRAAITPWPEVYLDAPAAQYEILRERYRAKEPGRIPLPRTTTELWEQHRYSVWARDPSSAREVDRKLGQGDNSNGFGRLASELVAWLRQPPHEQQLREVLEQIEREWGKDRKPGAEHKEPAAMLTCVLQLAQSHPTLLQTTALGDLTFWMDHMASGQGGNL